MFLFLVAIVTVLSPGKAESASQPNFLFLLVDDLGWADVGCFGSTFHETPNIDRLAGEGMRFTQGYAACPVCSPTRASILTGRHPVRVDITDWIPGQTPKGSKFRLLSVEDRDHLALEEVTLAEALRESGYQTFFAGKWHLGDEGYWPTEQGFDVNVGGNDKGSPPGGYYGPWKNPTLQAREPGEYLTERLTRESLDFLTRRDASRPFLLYLSYYNVHTPITPYKKRIDHYRKKAREMFPDAAKAIQEHDMVSRGRQDNPEFASMVAAVDDSVGELLKGLKDLGLEKDTVVFFFSDNGGLCTKPTPGPTSNLPLRSGKGWLYEGGVREPMIVRAPGITRPGTLCTTPVVSMDFFPTMLELAGLPLQPAVHADGESLLPLLRGETGNPQRPLYWHYPHHHGSGWSPGASIREGDWKLIEFYERNQVELYHLSEDPYEKQDVALQHPEVTKNLTARLHAWQKSMKAKMPPPNPDYRP